MEKVKTMLWFAGKVVISLAILNFLTKAILGVNIAMFIEDPVGTLQSKLGGTS